MNHTPAERNCTIAEALTFVDTNVLVYAHDVDATIKRRRAASLIESLWLSRMGLLSTQVLQEFYVTVTRKIATPLSHSEAVSLVRDYAAWRVHAIDSDDVLYGARIAHEHRFSFWDGLIVAAARRLGAATIASEDFQTGRSLEGIVIENPF